MTPGACQSFRSAPQKQPMPNIASLEPSGNGGRMRDPRTTCASATSTASARPGSARSREGIIVLSPYAMS